MFVYVCICADVCVCVGGPVPFILALVSDGKEEKGQIFESILMSVRVRDCDRLQPLLCRLDAEWADAAGSGEEGWDELFVERVPGLLAGWMDGRLMFCVRP